MDQRISVDWLANAHALAPRIATAAARIEAGRELPPDIVDALHEARLFRMLVPRSLNGEEVSPVVFTQVVEELAKADASTAWCVAQTSVCSTIARCLKPEIAAEIFKNDPRGVLAWGPSTSKNAKAIAEPGGFRVTGEWPFASGSRHATWLAAHSFVSEADGSLRHDASGEPVQKTFVVPRRSAVIKDVWHVIGLKGTGSDTYALTDVFVPEDQLIGPEHEGWRVANSTLSHERGTNPRQLVIHMQLLEELLRLAQENGAFEDRWLRAALAQAYVEIRLFQLHNLRSVSRLSRGLDPGPEGSALKLYWSEMSKRFHDTAMAVLGDASPLWKGADENPGDGQWQRSWLYYQASSIWAGTNEIQRNVIGERVLGLPRSAPPKTPS